MTSGGLFNSTKTSWETSSSPKCINLKWKVLYLILFLVFPSLYDPPILGYALRYSDNVQIGMGFYLNFNTLSLAERFEKLTNKNWISEWIVLVH